MPAADQGPADIGGVTNYWVDILGSQDGAPALRVWLLDSLEYGCNGHPGW